MAPRVSPSTVEWMAAVVKGGEEAFKDLGAENPLGMLDMLASKTTMNEVARLLDDAHLQIVEESKSTGVMALQIRSGYPSLSLYGAIRWAERHGFTRCCEQDAMDHIRSTKRHASCADYVSSHSKTFGSAGLDGYDTFHVYARDGSRQIRYTSTWKSDPYRIEGRTRLLVRRSPLRLLEGQPEPEGTYCLMIDRPIANQEELEGYLWLRELECECVTNLSSKVSDVLSDPGSMVNARLSDYVHCSTCYGRGNRVPVMAVAAPREICTRCQGTGRVLRKQHP